MLSLLYGIARLMLSWERKDIQISLNYTLIESKPYSWCNHQGLVRATARQDGGQDRASVFYFVNVEADLVVFGYNHCIERSIVYLKNQ